MEESINSETCDVVREKRCSIVDILGEAVADDCIMTPLFGVRPVVLNPADGTVAEGNDVVGGLVFSSSWPYMLCTVYGDHQRIRDPYLRPFLTGEGCIRDHYGPFRIVGDMYDAEVEHAFVGPASASETTFMGFPHEVKGSGLFSHVTPNFNWIEAPLPADSAHVLTASDEEPLARLHSGVLHLNREMTRN